MLSAPDGSPTKTLHAGLKLYSRPAEIALAGTQTVPANAKSREANRLKSLRFIIVKSFRFTSARQQLVHSLPRPAASAGRAPSRRAFDDPVPFDAELWRVDRCNSVDPARLCSPLHRSPRERYHL